MSDARCPTPAPEQELLGYWLRELDDDAQAKLEEHLFGCTECSARLDRLVNLAKAVRQKFRDGRLGSTLILSMPFVQQLKAAGMRIREYQIPAGGSVSCTIAPDDDLVVSHLAAPLEGVRRLDFVFESAGGRQRLEDIAFDPASGAVAFAPAVAELRKLGVSTHRVQLVAVGADAQRVIGNYTFNHSPWRI